jgi:hypothetical protein
MKLCGEELKEDSVYYVGKRCDPVGLDVTSIWAKKTIFYPKLKKVVSKLQPIFFGFELFDIFPHSGVFS